MSDYASPDIYPMKPRPTSSAASELMQRGDFTTAERPLSWALDFSSDHIGFLKHTSGLRWDEDQVKEALQPRRAWPFCVVPSIFVPQPKHDKKQAIGRRSHII
jgi:hypothetical protein